MQRDERCLTAPGDLLTGQLRTRSEKLSREKEVIRIIRLSDLPTPFLPSGFPYDGYRSTNRSPKSTALGGGKSQGSPSSPPRSSARLVCVHSNRPDCTWI